MCSGCGSVTRSHPVCKSDKHRVSGTPLPPQWQQRLLALVNARGWLTGSFVFETIRLLTAWQQAEGGNAQWNPLNTTEPYKGSTNFNGTGVQNYTKPTYGVIATAATLLNGNYNGILGALQGGTLTAEEIVNKNAAEFRVWGTNPDLILKVLAGG